MEKTITIRFKKLHQQAVLPVQAHDGDAGMDLHACESLSLAPGARGLARTGLAVEIPPGMEGQLRPRSGLALKHGITVLNAPGTIDAGYRGEVGVILINHGDETFEITPGMRIAQIVFAAVAPVAVTVAPELGTSGRGTGGFGSTGTGVSR